MHLKNEDFRAKLSITSDQHSFILNDYQNMSGNRKKGKDSLRQINTVLRHQLRAFINQAPPNALFGALFSSFISFYMTQQQTTKIKIKIKMKIQIKIKR